MEIDCLKKKISRQLLGCKHQLTWKMQCLRDKDRTCQFQSFLLALTCKNYVRFLLNLMVQGELILVANFLNS